MNAIAYSVAAVMVAGLLWDVARRMIASRGIEVRDDYDRKLFDLRFDLNKLRDEHGSDHSRLAEQLDAASDRITEVAASRMQDPPDVAKFNAATMNLANQLRELSAKSVTKEELETAIRKVRTTQAGMVAGGRRMMG